MPQTTAALILLTACGLATPLSFPNIFPTSLGCLSHGTRPLWISEALCLEVSKTLTCTLASREKHSYKKGVRAQVGLLPCF